MCRCVAFVQAAASCRSGQEHALLHCPSIHPHTNCLAAPARLVPAGSTQVVKQTCASITAILFCHSSLFASTACAWPPLLSQAAPRWSSRPNSHVQAMLCCDAFLPWLALPHHGPVQAAPRWSSRPSTCSWTCPSCRATCRWADSARCVPAVNCNSRLGDCNQSGPCRPALPSVLEVNTLGSLAKLPPPLPLPCQAYIDRTSTLGGWSSNCVQVGGRGGGTAGRRWQRVGMWARCMQRGGASAASAALRLTGGRPSDA